MGNTFSQMYIHIVFSVKFRESLIDESWKDELYKYITGIIQNIGHKVIVINGTKDHLHILIGYRPKNSLSDLVKHIKADSSKWINLKGFCPGKFRWQEGFGAFSYSHSNIDGITRYINNQESHHQSRSYRDEFVQFLNAFNVPYDNQYLPEDVR